MEENKDIDAIVELLDGLTKKGDGRIKINVEETAKEEVNRQYHHGRCDVGSPWACGTPFDVLE